MSLEILATVTRDGATLFTNVPMQLDFATPVEQHGGYGMVPSYRYDAICFQTLDIRQNDYCFDPRKNDPVTNTPIEYQVVGKPESFPEGHMEMKLDDRRTVNFS